MLIKRYMSSFFELFRRVAWSLGPLIVAANRKQEPVFIEHLLCAGIFTSLFCPQQTWEGSLTALVLQIRNERSKKLLAQGASSQCLVWDSKPESV